MARHLWVLLSINFRIFFMKLSKYFPKWWHFVTVLPSRYKFGMDKCCALLLFARLNGNSFCFTFFRNRLFVYISFYDFLSLSLLYISVNMHAYLVSSWNFSVFEFFVMLFAMMVEAKCVAQACGKLR